jgi:RNA polymerase sigma-70 factor (ECF subfamily)
MSKHPRDPAFDAQIVAFLPKLQSFARLLCRNRAAEEDLVSETIVRALDKSAQFRPGTNLLNWLMAIEKNTFFNICRSSKRYVEDPESAIASGYAVPPEQIGVISLKETMDAVYKMPPGRRNAFLLFWYEGRSQYEIAEALGIEVPTVRSRVSRARAELAEILIE